MLDSSLGYGPSVVIPDARFGDNIYNFQTDIQFLFNIQCTTVNVTPGLEPGTHPFVKNKKRQSKHFQFPLSFPTNWSNQRRTS